MSQTKSREASSTLAPVAVAAGIVMGPYLTTRQPHQTTEDTVAEPAKISKGGRKIKGRRAIVMAAMATATTLARGNVPASARGTPGITLRDPPASCPQVFFNPRLPLTKLCYSFLMKLKLKVFKKIFGKNAFNRLGSR